MEPVTPAAAPVSGKVSNGTIGGALVGVVTWALTYFIPAWQSGIPGPLQAFIPVITAAAGFYITGYASKHQATTAEVIRAVEKGQVVISQVEDVIHPVLTAGGGGTVTGRVPGSVGNMNPGVGRPIKDQPQA